MKRFLLCFVAGLSLTLSSAYAQDRTVSGRVTSTEDGSALPGVNVVLKGTAVGTSTDAEGKYSLSIPSAGGFLVFSFIGLESKEIEIGDRQVVDVSLSLDVTQLSEVVVTAFGIERTKDEVTYAAQSVKGSDLVVAQQTRPGAGLVGKVAGLQINIQNNGVNPSNQILLRGFRSITQNNSALMVIDGVISSQGAFDGLNPNDIESIEVLKGANAAALYGSDAANGALIITTKGGSNNGKFTVGVNSTLKLEEVAYMPDFQTRHGLGWAGNYDPIENTNWGPRYDGVTRQIGPTFPDGSFQAVPYAPIADNLKDFYQTGQTYQNTFYISGGDKDAKFYISYGNQTTSGVIPGDNYDRNTFRVNATKKIGKMTLGVNSSYLTDKKDEVGNTIGDQDRDFYWFLLNVAGNIPLSNYKNWDDPTNYGYADNYYNAYYQNPYWALGTNRDIETSNRLNANFSATYEINEKISATAKFGANSSSGNGKDWRALQEYNEDLQPSAATVTSFVEDSEFQSNEYNGQAIITGKFSFATDFSLTALLGGSFRERNYRESTIRANNLVIPEFYDISNGTGQLVGTVDESYRTQMGAFADVTLGFREWAFLNLTGRQDYVSTLKKGDNGYFYPSVGLSVILTEAIEALKNNNILSYAKVTLSNATVYNDLLPYQNGELWRNTTGLFQQQVFPLGDVTSFIQDRTTVDAAIKKEKLNTTEISTSLGFLQGRFSLDAAYFNTKTTDLITTATPSTASAANFYRTNIGELQSKGFELSVGGNVLTVGDFKWRLNVNYTSNEAVINSIKPGLEEIALQTYNGGTHGTFAIVGEAFPQIKATAYVRDPQGRVVVGADGNPIVGTVDKMGKTTPDYILGATNTLSWKGISLTATIDYRTGHVYYEEGSDFMEFTGRSVASVSSNRQDFVFPNSVIEVSEGVYQPNTNLPITGGQMLFWQNTYNDIKENYVKDATALKIREVALNYNFPASIVQKMKVVNKLSVGVIATNLFTWLPEENRFADPEFNNTTTGVGETVFAANSVGIGGFRQGPPTRTFGFNLNIEF